MLTQERLKELFHYEEETGVFTRVKISGKKCNPIGSVCGSLDIYGYLTIRIDNKQYKLHRLAFLYMTGSFPALQVDHVNRKRNDNRWCNLREVNASENAMNRKLNINSISKSTGVTRRTNRKIWVAQAMVNGKTHIRFFPDSRYESKELAFSMAEIYVSDLRKSLGFSNTHGLTQ